jgi:hypothetical protein
MDSRVKDLPQPDVAESIAQVVGTKGADEANQLVIAANTAAEGVPVDFKVTSAEGCAQAGTLVSAIRKRIDELTETRLEITRPMDASKKRVMDFFSGPISKLESANKLLSDAVLTWNREESARQAAAQAQLQALADKEREKLEKRADRAEASGKTEKAEELRQVASTVVAPIAAAAIPVSGAMGVRKVWKARVTDKTALIKAVVEGKVPESVLLIDESALNKIAAALKGSLNYPGVQPYEDESLARSRKSA